MLTFKPLLTSAKTCGCFQCLDKIGKFCKKSACLTAYKSISKDIFLKENET